MLRVSTLAMASKHFLSVREAIEQRDWNQAREQIVLVAETIQGLIGEIDRAAEVVKVNLRR